ncbi:hypothetical protein AmaxDRAFT_1718 [Limnospira maxima CS-328]|uniref:Uncharacterized protein n=1 Tax=Limnospira maxima CS-328 TaxID=513049 RepID=B5VYX6_LIMMA|nr:hypothetical protein AmaxDRAFT_1718 [Limnospira maxima CS-328]
MAHHYGVLPINSILSEMLQCPVFMELMGVKMCA